MRALTIALCLLATPALADVAGTGSVIDGETIEVHGQRIRLRGIDAPEMAELSIKGATQRKRPQFLRALIETASQTGTQPGNRII